MGGGRRAVSTTPASPVRTQSGDNGSEEHHFHPGALVPSESLSPVRPALLAVPLYLLPCFVEKIERDGVHIVLMAASFSKFAFLMRSIVQF